MYIVELTGRYFKALGVGCLLHNETISHVNYILRRG